MQCIASARLIAPESPRKAFYAIMVAKEPFGYLVAKESGIGIHVLDKRVWRFESGDEAFRFYNAKLKQKLNPNRRSPRKYILSA